MSDDYGPFEKHFSVSVTQQTCPLVTSNRRELYGKKGSYLPINCDMERIMQLDPHLQVSWRKGCNPLHKNGLILRLRNISKSDSGKYTCLTNFTYAGYIYTAAKTIQVFVTDPGPTPQKPIVVSPKGVVKQIVKLGLRYHLNCRVIIQMKDQDETMVYWLMNNSHVDQQTFPQLSVSSSKCDFEDNDIVSCHSNLSLTVQAEFLHIPFTCVAMNPNGIDNGTVVLYPASESYLYGGLALLAGVMVLALCFLILHLFKVDLVLAYRNFSPCLQRHDDGKLYDAYVSYPHDETSSARTFTLQVLPKVLEEDLGYRLFISGRDELPGAAVHDIIAEMVSKSRRLIIVLTSQTFRKPPDSTTVRLLPAETTFPDLGDLSEMKGMSWGPYERWVGVYDALVKGGLQVILVQVEGEVDEASLPESLRYISRTQGIIRWRQHYSTKPNGTFWKQLRYRMAPVQKIKLATAV
ncbi:interleukin-1 receptor type 1 isoform X2 [Brachyhypopomus gauderio]